MPVCYQEGVLPSGNNKAPPRGYVAKADSGPCRCGGSGSGLDSCGQLCCAASPWTDPDPNGANHYAKAGKTIAAMCYEKAQAPQTGQVKAIHGKCLDASQRNTNGGKVWMWDCDANNQAQQWTYTASAKQIKATHGKCLDAGQRNTNGGKVHMWDCNANNQNQQWTYTASAKQIKATYGKCLDASQRNTGGGKVHMWDCDTNNQNQQWVISQQAS